MHPTHLMYDAAAHTVQRAEVDSRLDPAAAGPCWLCGYPCDDIGGVPQKVIADTWTNADWAEEPRAPWLCAACAFSIAQKIPWPGRPRLQRMQTYSHLVAHGTWKPMTKADLSPALEVLLHPPETEWLLGLTTTGQKHMVFRTPANPGGTSAWSIRLEEQLVRCDAHLFRWLYETAGELYQAGVTKIAIEYGRPSPGMLMRPGALDVWERLSPALSPYMRGPALALAVFLLRKEEEGGQRDKGKPASAGARPGGGHPPVDRLEERQSAGVLGSADGLAESSRDDQLDLFSTG